MLKKTILPSHLLNCAAFHDSDTQTEDSSINACQGNFVASITGVWHDLKKRKNLLI